VRTALTAIKHLVFNVLNVNPVLFCSTATEFTHSLLVGVCVIRPFIFMFLLKDIKLIRKLVVLQVNKRHKKSILTLNVGHGTLHN
jgi:hypothetical protein